MKTIQITDPGKVRLIETTKPRLKPGHVLLKVAYVGFCGSDLNTFKGLNPLVQLPIVPGHEIGAIIEEVAEDVLNLKPGMHATVNPYTSCGQCAACLNGRSNACEFNQTLGVQRDGAMSEFILVPWQNVIADESLSVRELALVEPMSVGFHAISRADVTDVDIVMVIGCGMIGIGAIVRAALRGAQVIAVDIDDNKLSLAKRLGATHTINSSIENLHNRVSEITQARGADVIIEAVGRPVSYLAAISEVSYTGRVVYIGYAKEKIPFDTQFFVKKELDIRGSRNAVSSDFKAVVVYETRCLSVDELITLFILPKMHKAALTNWAANPGKGV